MDASPPVVTVRFNKFLPHWAVFQTDLRQTLRSWVYRLWVLMTVLAATGLLLYKVGLHNSCHGLRELRLGSSSEMMVNRFNKAGQLLAGLEGIELVPLQRPDECCGFGGTFAVAEEAVSCMMGLDRIHDHEQAGAEVMTAGDMSCLMHLYGLINRQKKPIQVMHVAEILAGRQPQLKKDS